MSQENNKLEVVGQLFKVKNIAKPKFSNQKESYSAFWIEDSGSKKCLLFTDREIKIAEMRSKKNQHLL